MKKYIKDKIKVDKQMNNYPRKLLNYKTPLESSLEEFTDQETLLA